MDAIKTQLLTMGFQESKIKRAIESCPEAQTLEQVMEWLISHEDELNSDQMTPKVANSEVLKTESKSEDKAPSSAGTVSGNDTSTQGVNPNETAADMAARKKITVEEARRIISERQAKRAEEERKKAIEDEKRRRLDGQKMAETRAELQDQERIRLAQQIRKEKMEKEAHRKQLLEQIARDREAMRLRNNPPSTSTTPKPASSSSTTSLPKTNSKECRIALRFPDGSSLVQKFSPQEQLAAVRLFVQMEKGTVNGIEFVAPPNKKLNDSMMNDTLEALGLCPASRLEVKYKVAEWADLD